MRLAVQGALLFAFIPLVLFLYLRQPLGPALSIALGVAVMFGHRFVAAPWMRRHASQRCLWCAAGAGRQRKSSPSALDGAGVPLVVRASGLEVRLWCCSRYHADCAARFLAFVSRFRTLIAVGIFAPLILLLAGSLSLAAGHPFISSEWNAWQFRVIVAIAVVSTSFAWRTSSRPADGLRSPFPLHNLFLLGVRNTLWVFRVVGAWWLVGGAAQL